MQEKVNFNGWPNCIRLSNGESELIIATDIGPRILHFGYNNGQNFFHLSPGDLGKMGGQNWRIYGGHRFWHAPEATPRSYCPDNDPVRYSFHDDTIKLTQAKEPTTGFVKEMEITLSPYINQVKVLHRLINQNLWDIELSPWGISALARVAVQSYPRNPMVKAMITCCQHAPWLSGSSHR